jgi:hypothetical protein
MWVFTNHGEGSHGDVGLCMLSTPLQCFITFRFELSTWESESCSMSGWCSRGQCLALWTQWCHDLGLLCWKSPWCLSVPLLCDILHSCTHHSHEKCIVIANADGSEWSSIDTQTSWVRCLTWITWQIRHLELQRHDQALENIDWHNCKFEPSSTVMHKPG